MGGNEIQYVSEAFTSNWLSTFGPNLTELEREFSKLMGVPSVALGSGTAAIHLGVKLLGLGPGQEMVTPTLTFAASCNPILYQHAVPVFVDSDRASWNLDPQLLADFLAKRARVNTLPKAVTVVHLFGQSADLDPILETCRRYELPLLEDAAECLGAQYKGKPPGTLGDVGVFSFNGNKIITSTGGGMLVSPRPGWVDKARYWSAQARDHDPEDLGNYVHSEVGYNYGLSNVLAGIARGQLEVLSERVKQRRAVFERYCQAFASLPGIEPQREASFAEDGRAEMGDGRKPGDGRSKMEDRASAQLPSTNSNLLHPFPKLPSPSSTLPPSRHTRWLSCFLIDEKRFGLSAAELIRLLDAANVASKPVWKPMHTQKLYEACECIGGAVAEDLHRRGICLPSSSSLTEEDQQFVIDRIREAHLLHR